MYPGRIDKFETVTPGRRFVRVIPDSVRTMEQYVTVEFRSRLGLTTCTVLDHAWTITRMMWEHLKCSLGEWRVSIANMAHTSVHGAEEIWGCTCVTTPHFFSQIDSPAGRSSETVADNLSKSVVIMWGGLNVEERESSMSWMTTSKL
jgi:hypothetical protein